MFASVLLHKHLLRTEVILYAYEMGIQPFFYWVKIAYQNAFYVMVCWLDSGNFDV